MTVASSCLISPGQLTWQSISESVSATCRGESPSSRAAAAAAPMEPRIGGGYQPPASIGARRLSAIRQERSHPSATAVISSRPDTPPLASATARAAGISAAFGWPGARSKVSSKSSACAIAPLASAASSALVRNPQPRTVACGEVAPRRAASMNGSTSSLIPLAPSVTPTASSKALLVARTVAGGRRSNEAAAMCSAIRPVSCVVMLPPM